MKKGMIVLSAVLLMSSVSFADPTSDLLNQTDQCTSQLVNTLYSEIFNHTAGDFLLAKSHVDYLNYNLKSDTRLIDFGNGTEWYSPTPSVIMMDDGMLPNQDANQGLQGAGFKIVLMIRDGDVPVGMVPGHVELLLGGISYYAFKVMTTGCHLNAYGQEVGCVETMGDIQVIHGGSLSHQTYLRLSNGNTTKFSIDTQAYDDCLTQGLSHIN